MELWINTIQKYIENQNYIMEVIVIMLPFVITGLIYNGIKKIIRVLIDGE